MGREETVSHPQPLTQSRLAQELSPGRLRGQDLQGVAEDDVSDAGGHPGAEAADRRVAEGVLVPTVILK